MYYNYVRIALVGALILLHQLFYHSGPYHIETRILICRANQWTGFYMIGTSAMKELKSPINKNLTYFWLYLFRLFLTLSKKYWSTCKGGWSVAKSNHLVFLRLTSINIPSMSCGCLSSFSCLHGITSLMHKRARTRFLFLSNMKGLE